MLAPKPALPIHLTTDKRTLLETGKYILAIINSDTPSFSSIGNVGTSGIFVFQFEFNFLVLL